MNLVMWAAQYGVERSLCTKKRKGIISAAKQLSEFWGGIQTEELASEIINEWLLSLESTDKPNTIRTKRTVIGTIWRSANELGIAPPMGRLRRIKVPRTNPEALTSEEVSQLIAAASLIAGKFKGTTIPRSVYWRSLYMAYWDTGLRISDLRSIERNWIWPGGFVSIVQSKVQRSHRVQLRPETIQLIDTLLNGRRTGLIWDTLNDKNFFKAQRKLFVLAGVRGSGKWVRRSSASYVERDNPGMGWRHLGHASPGLAERCYLDPRIVAPKPTLPPALPLE